MIEFIDKTSTASGTPLNRKNMMALQGFYENTLDFQKDGTIVETNGEGHTKTTTFNSDGSITEKFIGKKVITKTTIFNKDGTIKEVIS